MTPEQLATVIMAGVGVVVQLLIMYFPGFNEWYDNQPNKGAVTLGMDVVFAGLYFGAGCVPFLAAALKIAVSCDMAGAFSLVYALFIIATGQTVAYSVLKNKARELRDKRQGYG